MTKRGWFMAGFLKKRMALDVALSFDELTNTLYRSILGRAPDESGRRGLLGFFQTGGTLADALQSLIASGEHQARVMSEMLPAHSLPDLRTICPEHMHVVRTDHDVPATIFRATTDADFQLLEDLIAKYRYYDVPGVWGTKIDLDKEITAALVRGLGAKSCLELGCFSGAVISLLERSGIDVAGLDLSHLAFVLAYPNVRDRMIFGDLLSASFGDRRFDSIIAMDILEHLNPTKLEKYIQRMDTLLSPNGYIYINSPMFGPDEMFGTVFPSYLEEWHQVGDASYWRDMDCDELGWPKHGHLIWASPAWWEQTFIRCGFVRDRAIEGAIHEKLGAFFETSPSRKCFFVLKRKGHEGDSASAIQAMTREIATLKL